jgi:glycosyltransferase involved in cell wall biosynthesis
LIVGAGPSETQIDEQIRSSRYSSSFRRTPFQSDIEQVIAGLDAIVVCSDHEGVPMSVLEAAALGVPIISVPLPSLQEIIASGVRGRIARGASPEAIAAAIEEQFSEKLQPAALPGPDWVYSSATMARHYKRLYDEMMVA